MFGSLVDQDRAMFGFRHWDKFHILVSESGDRFDGLEHEDSPYNAIADAGLVDTAILEPRLRGVDPGWNSYRRWLDFYTEGVSNSNVPVKPETIMQSGSVGKIVVLQRVGLGAS